MSGRRAPAALALRGTVMAALLVAGSWLLGAQRPAPAPAAVSFTEVSAAAGCRNLHSKPRLAEELSAIMPWLTSVGAAVAAADFDGDGWIDFYVTNSGRDSANRLFANRGDGTFTDVAEAAGVARVNRVGASMDALAFDHDNDGDQDLFLVRWSAPSLLFENRGDGTFVDVTAGSGAGVWGNANGAIALDYDRDGRLDLLVLEFFAATVRDPRSGATVHNDLWAPVTTEILHESFTHAANGGRNTLLHNLGGGRFEDVTLAAGLDHTGWSLDAAAGDLDNDGWPDLYVANDFGPDELYLNTGAGGVPGFRTVIDRRGHPGIGSDWWKGMNVDLADVDGNGWLDLYITNVMVDHYKTDEGNMLWLGFPEDGAGDGGGAGHTPAAVRFENAALETGTAHGGWGWAGKFADFNADGWLDLFTVNGFVTGADPARTYWFQLQEMVTQLEAHTRDVRSWAPMGDLDLAGGEPSRLFLQRPPEGDGVAAGRRLPRFSEQAAASGIVDLADGRGVAVADYDRDGDPDLYVANQGSASLLYRNDGSAASRRHHWLGLLLEGAPEHPRRAAGRLLASNRDAIGARVEVCAGGRCQMREVAYHGGFASQSERRLYFGLGTAAEVERVTVRWPSGRRSHFGRGELAADRDHLLRETAGGGAAR